MGKVITFQTPREIPTSRDAIEYSFPFRVVDSDYIGAPEEMAKSTQHALKVIVSGTLEACWRMPRDLLSRVLFEYGKRHIKQKILDHALSQSEELVLHTGNAETRCPFDPTRIEEPSGATLEIEEPDKALMEDLTFLQLASSIIETRDYINALFHEKHGSNVLYLSEERDLLQLFRDATSSEEFSSRICSLARTAGNLNELKLRELTGITDKQAKSIQLLKSYLQKSGKDLSAIDTLKAINRLRQGYPVHGDHSEGVLEAHRYFGLDYPIQKYSKAWQSIMRSYLECLKKLLDQLK